MGRKDTMTKIRDTLNISFIEKITRERGKEIQMRKREREIQTYNRQMLLDK